MKNTTIIAFLCISCVQTGQGQGLYIGLKAGYSLGLAGENLGTIQKYNTSFPDANGDRDFSSSSKSVNGSYGEGFTPTLQIGYMFSKYIGAELGASYLIGRKFENTVNYNGYNYDGDPYSTTSSYKTGATSFYINPSLVFRLHNESKFIPYAKMGLYIGLINKLGTDYKYTDNIHPIIQSPNSKSIYSNESTGNVNLGLTASLGSDYMITKNISVFGEVNIIATSLYLKNNKVINSNTYTYGNNKHSSTYIYEKNYSEVSSYQSNTSNNNSNNSSTTQITGPGIESGTKTVYTYDDGGIKTNTEIFYSNGDYNFTSNSILNAIGTSVPLSSIGIAIGARYYFGK